MMTIELDDAPMLASPDSEKIILGAILDNPSRLPEVAAVLSQSDFSLDSNRRIFQAIVKLCERDGSVDIVTLCQYLEDSKEIADLGGRAYIFGLTEGLYRGLNIESHIKAVKDKELCRNLVRVADGLRARVYSQDQPGLDSAAWAISEISAIADSGTRRTEVFEAVELAVEAEDKLLNNPPDTPAMPTGLQMLDANTGGGIREGELWIVGASPSRGKTTLGRQIALHTARRGDAVYVQSGEMSRQSWFNISACLLEELPTYKLREPRLLTGTERERLRSGIRRLAEMPLWISDPGGIHIDRLIFNAKRQKYRNGLKLLVVDYAQIVRANGKTKLEQVSEVADRLRLFAHDEKVATILLSQMARPEGRNLNARPNMFGLKETGRLEEAADTALLLFRPIENDQFTGSDEIIIGKQRNGALTSVPVYLNGEYLRFEER